MEEELKGFEEMRTNSDSGAGLGDDESAGGG